MESIRLVIWDLDETFWEGTLSETEVNVPKRNIDLINTLVDRGIMNSICSKNDFDKVKERLEIEDLWDLFIFPKVSWNPKGEQVREIIEQVKLRPETVLFIDDNPNNLAEVKFYNPDINTAGVDIIDGLLDNDLFIGKNDSKRSRLKQYKILEAKQEDKEKASSNLEFLKSSGIIVELADDCMSQFDRIVELINRTNQLNFTKNRLNEKQVEELLNSNSKCGYVKSRDNYGDYGVVGFYSLTNGVLDNYCFSCRTIGLGVEQYTYAQLGFPEIATKGDTVSKLEKGFCPEWINSDIDNLNNEAINEKISKKLIVSLVGGCDLKSVAFYLSGSNIELKSLYNYDYNGFIVHREHTEIIRGSVEYDDKTKEWLINELPFYDKEIFNNIVFDQDVDILVFSPLIDYSLGVYRSKKDERITFVYEGGQKQIDINDRKLSESLINEINNSFSFEGIISQERLYDNLVFIRSKLNPKTVLIVLNGSEQDVYHPIEKNMAEVHKRLNKSVCKFCENYDNTFLLDVNKIIRSTNDHTDCIRHYTRRVYYEIANEIVSIISAQIGNDSSVFTINKEKNTISKRIRIKTFLRKIGLYKVGYKIFKIFKK